MAGGPRAPTASGACSGTTGCAARFRPPRPPSSGSSPSSSRSGKNPARKNPFGLVLTPEPQDTPQLVRLHSDRVALTPYMCFDEAYFKTLESMQWNRDNGCVELIPIAVGLP